MLLTKNAIKKFKKEINNQNKAIKIDLHKTGCNGFSYKIELVDINKINKEEVNQEIFEEVIIIYNKNNFNILKDLTIDFEKDGFNQKLKFSNPIEKGTCGCGLSFRI